MKKDPSNHEKKYKTWKDKINGIIPKISKTNSDTILRYIIDMEKKLNISIVSVKGGRSYAQLNNIRQRKKLMAEEYMKVLK